MKTITLTLILILYFSLNLYAGEEITLMFPKVEKAKPVSSKITYK
jgi:hypothetical protein